MLRRFGVLASGLVLALASAALNTGCGTVLGHAGEQPITLHLNPDDPAFKDAEVTVDGFVKGKFAGTYLVSPKAEGHKFDVRAGQREGHGGVTREIMPMVVVCDAFMLLFPILIDYFDGGMWSWKPDLAINMGTAPAVEPQPTDTIRLPNSQPEMVKCANCGEQRPANSEVCPHCGLK
jgi:hypothetical protein